MARETIDRLIINSPYKEPDRYWNYDRESRLFDEVKGRRPAGYLVASKHAKSFDDPGELKEIPFVNKIRSYVKKWRDENYPGVTGITRRLLEHWTDEQEYEARRFFFCQLEAIETIIWVTEILPTNNLDIVIPGDGGEFTRLCAKMATGTGKTVVMSMLIAWQILNSIVYPKDDRFARNILIIAPGLTVKNRLAVLKPQNSGNYYEEFRVLPSSLKDKLRQGKVIVQNWHALTWESGDKYAKRRSVDKRGPKSDLAYAKEVLGDLLPTQNILVINDEAHHAWRISPGTKFARETLSSAAVATKWIEVLDRVHKIVGILVCYDFTATPFVQSGSQNKFQESLFGWIVSDFGLNDAIEAGLVKTPRVVIHDDARPDAKTLKSRLYHIYNDEEVKDDIQRRVPPETPLPDLVINGYYLLGYDWKLVATQWEELNFQTPPVMITVTNRTETAARIHYAFSQGSIDVEELCDTDRILHIDSKVLDQAEATANPIAEIDDQILRKKGSHKTIPKFNRKEQAEFLRHQVDTVGQVGQPGEKIQNVISVGMLSEGWDARTVTHIMGLRAFTSQLLCEQVVGRGLRRTSYDVDPEKGLFTPEYVNVIGIPFTFLPHEEYENGPEPPTPKTKIEPVAEKTSYQISWPNLIRIEHVSVGRLSLNWDQVDQLELNAFDTSKLAELAPVVDGKPDVVNISSIDLEHLARKFRTQRIIFVAALRIYEQMSSSWTGNKDLLLAQLVQIVEQFIRSDKVGIKPVSFNDDDIKRRLVLTLNITKVVSHIWQAIRFGNYEKLEPVFDHEKPICSTEDMSPWHTGRPCKGTFRSHINYCVCDGAWEATTAQELDNNENVEAWVKNDHLGFEVRYVYRGIVKKYRPDFIIRLKSGNCLVLEIKGRDKTEVKIKRRFLQEWVEAVNTHGGFGVWSEDIAFNPSDVVEILNRH